MKTAALIKDLLISELFPQDIELGALEIFKQDQNAGYVEGGRKPGFARGSERVGVYIESEAPGKTKVSIENRKAFAGMIFAVNWTNKLFQQIDSELGK